MVELLDIFNLDFEVQGIATYLKGRIQIVDSLGKYKDVDFNAAVTCYIRQELETNFIDKGLIECDTRDYMEETPMHIVVIDRQCKYTLDSLEKTIKSQLNTTKDITILKTVKDFNKINTDEQLSFTDGQLLKISFNYRYEFINDCEGLVCNC